MDETATKNVIEAALLAAGRPITFDKLVELFSSKGVDVDRGEVRSAIKALGDDYTGRGIELKEVASGYRIQVRSNTRDWLDPLFEERAPRYTRALLETLALVAYRQPITRAEIEDVRGVAVSSNIVRTLIERGWVRVVGYRDVPGKPSMLGTTREFLDYFGLKRLEDLPPLSEIKDFAPTTNPQSDLVDALEETLAQRFEADGIADIGHDESPVSTNASHGTHETASDGDVPEENALDPAEPPTSATAEEAVATGAEPVSASDAAVEAAPGADPPDGAGAADADEPASEYGSTVAADAEEATGSEAVETAAATTGPDEAETALKIVQLRQPEPEQAE